MLLGDLIALIAENLRRIMGRAVMTALGVVVGTAAVVILISLGAGLRRQALQSLGSGATEIRITGGMDTSLTRSPTRRPSAGDARGVADAALLSRIEALEGVAWVIGFEPLMASVDLESGYACLSSVRVLGLNPGQAGLLEFNIADGAIDLQRGHAVLGARVADSLGYSDATHELVGRPLRLYMARFGEDGTLMERAVPLEVAGVLAPRGSMYDFSVYIAEREALALNSWLMVQRRDPARQGYPELLVKVAVGYPVAEVEGHLMAMGLSLFSEYQQAESLGAYFDELQALLGGIAAVSLLVSAFSIANMMSMAIYERTREIGLMKAIGASHRDVMFVFLGEAGSLGLLGGLFGVALGMAVNGLVNTFGDGTAAGLLRGMSGAATGLQAFTPLWLPFVAVGFAVCIGVVSGIYPACRAAKLSPVVALKS